MVRSKRLSACDAQAGMMLVNRDGTEKKPRQKNIQSPGKKGYYKMHDVSDRLSGPVFIIGMPRSGTKLLRDLLKMNPGIGIPNSECKWPIKITQNRTTKMTHP